MANYTTTVDIHAAVLSEAGELASGSDFSADALNMINRAYFAICLGGAEFAPDIIEEFWWLRSSDPDILTLEVSYETGTVNISKDSSGPFTFTNLPASPSRVGWRFKVIGWPETYIISAHSLNSATLDSDYNGDTDADASFVIFKVDYDLASTMLRPISPFIVQAAATESMISGLHLSELNRKWPLRNIQAAIPSNFAVTKEANGIFSVRFSHYPEDQGVRLEIDYLEVPADLTISPDTTPRMPRLHRRLLVDGALYYLMRTKSDKRRQEALAVVRTGMLGLANENKLRATKMGTAFGMVLPRQWMLDRRIVWTEFVQ